MPHRYREPVVLCYLEGLSTEAAAVRIGCPRGTVLSRLSRARDRLRKRLTRRGMALPAVLLGTIALPEAARAALPLALGEATVQAALSFVGKESAQAASASAPILAREVLYAMTISNLKTLGVAALILGAIGLGVEGLARPAPGSLRQDAPPPNGTSSLVTKRVDVSADDLISVTGLDIYKFQVTFTKGQRFRVVYRTLEWPDRRPATWWTGRFKRPATVR